MKNKINLHFSSVHRGPGRVVDSLARSLHKIGWEIFANDIPRKDVYQGCLQPTNAIPNLGRDALMGPNLFVLPSEWGDYCRRFDHYVVPSDWVKNKYSEFNNINHATIDVWPAGIDTDIWQIDGATDRDSVLVYHKNRDERDLLDVLEILRREKISHKVLTYGSYEEKDLYESCINARACILVTGTESQGFAYMQILSMGIPCYVMNREFWDFDKSYKIVPATSVPYFDQRCGIIEKTFELEKFMNFLENISSFNPRSYILENHTLEKSAKNYIEILKRNISGDR